MNSTPKTSLSRKEWYAALLFAHGATTNESANALLVRPSRVQQLATAARTKLGLDSRSQIRHRLRAGRSLRI
jgi:DNA-binding CsgD family transcriptional regulator